MPSDKGIGILITWTSKRKQRSKWFATISGAHRYCDKLENEGGKDIVVGLPPVGWEPKPKKSA